jgi:hypothetical protein
MSFAAGAEGVHDADRMVGEHLQGTDEQPAVGSALGLDAGPSEGLGHQS